MGWGRALLVLNLVLICQTYGSWADSASASVSGYVQTTEGDRLAHLVVTVDGIGSSPTSDSGQFIIPLPPDHLPGDSVVFSVGDDWIVLHPFDGVRGEMNLPRFPADIKIEVAKKGDDQRLLSKLQMKNVVKEVLLQRAKNVDDGARNEDSMFLGRTATKLGLSVPDLKAAIDKWVAAPEPDQKGVAALYAGRLVEASELIEDSIRKHETNIVQQYLLLGTAYFQSGKYALAKETLFKAHAIRTNDPDVLNSLGAVLNSEGEYQQARDFLEQARTVAAKWYEPSDPLLAVTFNNLAYSYTQLSDYAKAETLYKQAIEIDRKFYGADHPEVATDLGNLGFLYLNEELFKKAEEPLKQALDINLENFGHYDSHTARNFSNLGKAYEGQATEGNGDYGPALGFYEKAVEADKHQQNPNNQSKAVHLINLASLYERLHTHSEEIEGMYKEALDLDESSLPSDSPEIATDQMMLGHFYTGRQEYDKAISHLEDARKIDTAKLQSGHPARARDAAALAVAYAGTKKYRKAATLAAEAAQIYKQLGKNNERGEKHVEVLFLQARIELQMGHIRKAESYCNDALGELKFVSPTDIVAAAVFNCVASLSERHARFKVAEEYYEKARTVFLARNDQANAEIMLANLERVRKKSRQAARNRLKYRSGARTKPVERN